MVSTLQLESQLNGRPLSGDDAAGTAMPWNQAGDPLNRDFTLPDGYHMTWLPVPGVRLRAKQSLLFRFRLIKPDGTAPQDMAFYMGMLGHAAFVKTDGTVFAHLHPSGSVSMAALMLAQGQQSSKQAGELAPSAGMQMDEHGGCIAFLSP